MGPFVDGALAELRWHWDEAYSITILDGRWIAQRHDTRETVTADSAEALNQAIYEDYTRRPVPRD
jgi:hypothetical protein